MELMTVIHDREEEIAQSQQEARRLAEGGRRHEAPLEAMTRRITAKAKGRRR